MKEYKVLIHKDGRTEYVDSPDLAVLGEGAKGVRRRASRVEPWNPLLRTAFRALRWAFGESGAVAEWTRKWKCFWRVDLRLSGGPVLPVEFADRAAAIEEELKWLRENNLGTAATRPGS